MAEAHTLRRKGKTMKISELKSDRDTPWVYMIINLRRKTYVMDENPSFDGEWKARFPHVANEDWLDVWAPRLSSFDMVSGIPYVYDLCYDGMLATMLVDADDYSAADIDKAKKMFRGQHDVVRLTVLKLHRATGTK